MVFPFVLLTGFVGLLTTAALGFLHMPGAGHHGPDSAGTSGAPGHAGAHAHAVDLGHHAPLPHHTPHAHTAGAHHAHAGDAPLVHHGGGHSVSALGRSLVWLAPLASPLTWFSWLFGAGAAGTVAELLGLGAIACTVLAVLGAVAFQLGVVRPIWRTVFHFATTPASNLGGCVYQHVEAVTTFNARHEGIVRVTIDGHSSDVLARLVDSDRAGPRVKRGVQLVIRDVDPRTNTCLVARA